MTKPSFPLAPRTALFLPASNPRAVAKARTLAVDMVILDLEDAVPEEQKAAARTAAVDAIGEGFGDRLLAVRINASDTPEHGEDVAAARGTGADFVILPKAEDAMQVNELCARVGIPVIAMIETPAGVLAGAEIAAQPRVAGLIAGTNDLRAGLRIPPAAGREGLALALQTIVLAARAGGCWALDGVFNALGDADGLAVECREGRAMGFDGKTLIHPNQLEVATRAFGPDASEVEEAEALVAAATGGAERFRDRMIEAMHVEQARELLARAHRPLA
ncbi:HpcH/HpaI aldolase/citrate lyase family protein [Stakelama saccharophila]|uniref:CoA ester lyase n=1 Tax=Stakelama saccharophila TaxID=3075605 RepID=A0ABZ0B5L2_9SPHN|nr:CoA ester lyase [Stakelama sp. W311]WNO52497.1 CoA ester lyase [Stakelama sp. W311]